MAVRSLPAKPHSKQVEVLVSESSDVNSGNEIIQIAEVTMPQTALQQEPEKSPEEEIFQVDDDTTEYANVCGFHVHVRSLLRNREIRRQLKPFIEEEIVDATEFQPTLCDNTTPLKKLKNGSINHPPIQTKIPSSNDFGHGKVPNGLLEGKKVKFKSILKVSYPSPGHDLDYSASKNSDIAEQVESATFMNDDDIIIDKILVNHKSKRQRRSKKFLATVANNDSIKNRQRIVIDGGNDKSVQIRNGLQWNDQVEKNQRNEPSTLITESIDAVTNHRSWPDEKSGTKENNASDGVIWIEEPSRFDQTTKEGRKRIKMVGNEITIFRKKKHRKKPLSRSMDRNFTQLPNPDMALLNQKEIPGDTNRTEVDHQEIFLDDVDHVADDTSASKQLPPSDSPPCSGTSDEANNTFQKGLNIIIKEETILPDDYYGNSADFEVDETDYDSPMLEHLHANADENVENIEMIPVFKEEQPWIDDHFDSGDEYYNMDSTSVDDSTSNQTEEKGIVGPKKRVVRRNYRRRKHVINRRNGPPVRPAPSIKKTRNLSACSRCGRMFGPEDLIEHEKLCTVVTEFSDAETHKCPMCPYETEDKEKLYKHISYRHVLGTNKECNLVKKKIKERISLSRQDPMKTQDPGRVRAATLPKRSYRRKIHEFNFTPKYTSKQVVKGYKFHLRSLMMVYCSKCNLQSNYHKGGLMRQDRCRRCEGSVRFFCAQCGEFFLTYSLLRIHVVESYKLMDNRLCCMGCQRQNFVLYCNLRTHEMNCIKNTYQCFRFEPYVRLGNCNDIIRICKGLPINLFAHCTNCITTSYVLDESCECVYCGLPLSFKCQLCRELLSSRSSLREHLMGAHFEILHNCPKCRLVLQEPLVPQPLNGAIKS